MAAWRLWCKLAITNNYLVRHRAPTKITYEENTFIASFLLHHQQQCNNIIVIYFLIKGSKSAIYVRGISNALKIEIMHGIFTGLLAASFISKGFNFRESYCSRNIFLFENIFEIHNGWLFKRCSKITNYLQVFAKQTIPRIQNGQNARLWELSNLAVCVLVTDMIAPHSSLCNQRCCSHLILFEEPPWSMLPGLRGPVKKLAFYDELLSVAEVVVCAGSLTFRQEAQ